jgi:chemotaxis response regulator CheB
MSIRVLLADDSEVMRHAILKVLSEEPNIEVVGEAASVAETLQLISVVKPDVLLMDLYMFDDDEYPPDVMKSRILQNTNCVVAISIATDEKAHALAQSLGANVLLDKLNLYSELIPALTKHCPPLKSKVKTV